MKSFIVLLRGINVGGHKKVPMAELRELLSSHGFEDVKTYIQTGNIVLKTTEVDPLKIESVVYEAIRKHFGFEVSVMVKSRNDIERILNNCPFEMEKKEKSYFAILHDIPSKDLVQLASHKTYDDEIYNIKDDCIYFYSEKGYGQAKFNLNYFERKLKTTATARNYNTMVKLLSL